MNITHQVFGACRGAVYLGELRYISIFKFNGQDKSCIDDLHTSFDLVTKSWISIREFINNLQLSKHLAELRRSY